MTTGRKILVRVAIAALLLAGGVFAFVRFDIWQAERRAQQELNQPAVDEPTTQEEPTQ